uniref:G-protein coupled receptors family 3 profile domain-containing protein n=1 Tax=Romanomermis culicivorax TaxID=13658 RepID=A0A915IKC1_ROMCU
MLVQATSLCMCLSASGTVALCCFFAPKVYIVLFQPEKNTRHHGANTAQTTGFQKMQMTVVNQQMRFLSRPNANTPLSAPGSEMIPTTGTMSLFSVKSSESTTQPNSIVVGDVPCSPPRIDEMMNNTTCNSVRKKKNRSMRNQESKFKKIFAGPNGILGIKKTVSFLPKSSAKEKRKAIVAPNNAAPIQREYRRTTPKLVARTDESERNNFSSLVNENTPFLFSIKAQNASKNDPEEENGESKSDQDYSSLNQDQDNNNSDVRETTPDSYTEPARRNPKLHQTPLVTTALEKSALLSNDEQNDDDDHTITRPLIHKTSKQQLSDWMLINPNNEFESIISDIANRKATFV